MIGAIFLMVWDNFRKTLLQVPSNRTSHTTDFLRFAYLLLSMSQSEQSERAN